MPRINFNTLDQGSLYWPTRGQELSLSHVNRRIKDITKLEDLSYSQVVRPFDAAE